MKQTIKALAQVTPLKITVLVIALALVLFVFDFQFLRLVELKTLDLRMVSRGELKPGNETVIATIDERSLAELGRWPWPRTTIARLVDRLKADGARTVGFDIVFAEPDTNANLKTIDELARELQRSGLATSNVTNLLNKKRDEADTDAILAASIEKAGNITLGYFFHFPRKSNEKELAHITPNKIRDNAARIENSRFVKIGRAHV